MRELQFQGVTMGGSGRVESREKMEMEMEMAEKGVLIPADRRHFTRLENTSVLKRWM